MKVEEHRNYFLPNTKTNKNQEKNLIYRQYEIEIMIY